MDSTGDKPVVFLVELLTKYLSVFGITPWYSFKKRNLVHSKIFKCYSIILAIAVTVLSLGSTFMRFTANYQNLLKIFIVENVVVEIAALSFFLATVLGSSVWNTRTWEKLFRKIQKIESMPVLARSKTNGLVSIGTVMFLFALGNIYLVSVFILDFGYHYYRSNTVPRYYVSILIFRYIKFITCFMAFFVVLIMQHKYEEINWLCRGKMVQEMSQFLQLFNKLFGWPILLICFFSAAQVLDCLTFVRDRGTSEVFQHRWQLFIHMLYAFEITVWLAAVIFCCDSVVEEAENLLRNCYRLEQVVPLLSKELDELQHMKNLIRDNIPRFTAAGLFEIRRSTLLSLLGTITTYFIVALQFSAK